MAGRATWNAVNPEIPWDFPGGDEMGGLCQQHLFEAWQQKAS